MSRPLRTSSEPAASVWQRSLPAHHYDRQESAAQHDLAVDSRVLDAQPNNDVDALGAPTARSLCVGAAPRGYNSSGSP